jgi:isopentenyl-diphosphate delta-isomerase
VKVEEMGFKTDLKELFILYTKHHLIMVWTEHEFDHVMIGYYDEKGDKPRRSWGLEMDGYWSCKSDLILHPNLYGMVQNHIWRVLSFWKTIKYSVWI